MTDKYIGEILSETVSENKSEIVKALDFQNSNKGKIGEILINSGVISDDQLTSAFGLQFGYSELKTITKDINKFDLTILNGTVPHWFITNKIIPLCLIKEKYYFLINDPLNLYPIEAVKQLYPDNEIIILIGTERDYRELASQFKLKYLKKKTEIFNENEIEKLRDLAKEAPIIKFVNSMITRAAEYRASDIHIEYRESTLKIRYRIDGVLQDMDMATSEMASAVISRVKIMSNLDIGEKRLPQDGRIQIKVSGRLFDIRVSTLPTIHGENIVLRLLEKENINFNITSLGLHGSHNNTLNELISNPFGMILITGPTGSGKSTSLYSILNELNVKGRKIITVEDPVEYQIEGISQVNVHEQIGLNFETILRNILRQDPDIIMIGEIRDKATAEIAIQASLTGHLVLATLHTNDAVSAITRLLDMGVDDYLINSSLLGVIAQRLLRKVCPDCSELKEYDRTQIIGKDLVILDELKMKDTESLNDAMQKKLSNVHGCDKCAHTGYKGRTGIFEILKYSEDIKSLIISSKDYDLIKKSLEKKDFKTLRHDALLKLYEGITTIEEVYRVT